MNKNVHGITSRDYRSLVGLKRCPRCRFYFHGGLQARALNRTPQVPMPILHIGSKPQPDQLASPMGLVQLAEARDEGEVPIAPDLYQRARDPEVQRRLANNKGVFPFSRDKKTLESYIL
jgi:hypothetical protein